MDGQKEIKEEGKKEQEYKFESVFQSSPVAISSSSPPSWISSSSGAGS